MRLNFGSNPELPSWIPAVIDWHNGFRMAFALYGRRRKDQGLSRVLELLGKWHMLAAEHPKSGFIRDVTDEFSLL